MSTNGNNAGDPTPEEPPQLNVSSPNEEREGAAEPFIVDEEPIAPADPQEIELVHEEDNLNINKPEELPEIKPEERGEIKVREELHQLAGFIMDPLKFKESIEFHKEYLSDKSHLIENLLKKTVEKTQRTRAGPILRRATLMGQDDSIRPAETSKKVELKWGFPNAGPDIEKDYKIFAKLIDVPIYYHDQHERVFPFEDTMKTINEVCDFIQVRSSLGKKKEKRKEAKQQASVISENTEKIQENFFKEKFEKQKEKRDHFFHLVKHNGDIIVPGQKEGEEENIIANFFDDLIAGDVVITFPNDMLGKHWIDDERISFTEALDIYSKTLGRESLMGILPKKETERIKRLFYNALLFFHYAITQNEKKKRPSVAGFFEYIMDIKIAILRDKFPVEMINEKGEQDKAWKNINSKGLATEVMRSGIISMFFPFHVDSESMMIPKPLFNFAVRKAMIVKFNSVQVYAREFLSHDREKIFLVIKSSNRSLENVSNLMPTYKEMEIGMVDLNSLRPVDSKMRPYIMKNFKMTPEEEEKQMRRMSTKVRELVKKQLEKKVFEFELGGTSEHALRSGFKEIKKLHPLVLRKYIERKTKEVEDNWAKIFSVLHREDNLKVSHEAKVQIKQDEDLSKDQYILYTMYITHLNSFLNRLKKLYTSIGNKDSKVFLKNNIGFLFHLIMMKAKGDANQIFNESYFRTQETLMTIWDYLGTDPVAPTANYSSKFDNKIWKTYQINELGHRSIFSPANRIMMVDLIVKELTNIHHLHKEKLTIDYFALNDSYFMDGKPKSGIFFEVFDTDRTGVDPDILKFFNELSDEADDTDFINDSIKAAASFKLFSIFTLPFDIFRNYYGEKITLYFVYLCHYARSLVWPGLIGLILFALQMVFLSIYAYIKLQTIVCLNGLLSVFYSTWFVENWKIRQELFAVKYGQKEAEELEVERPDFKGDLQRSIATDKVNSLFYPSKKRKLILSFSLTIAIIILAFVLSCVYVLLFSKEWLIDAGVPSGIATYLPSIINSAQIFIFNMIYKSLAKFNNQLENHRTLSSFEMAYITKIFAFSFVNTFNSFYIIAFLKYILGIQCSGFFDDTPDFIKCFDELSVQVFVIFATNFGLNFLEIGLPILKFYLSKGKLNKIEHDNTNKFKEIDEEIEKQAMLADYQEELEIDGTMSDYMELVLQFGFLSLFSVAFPLGFSMALITNVMEIYVDRKKILEFNRRPFPQVAPSIGPWLLIIELICYIGLFTTAGIMSYSVDVFVDDRVPLVGLGAIENYERNIETGRSFVILLLFFLSLKYLLSFYSSHVPSNVLLIMQRHKMIKKKVLEKGLPINSRISKAAMKFWLPESVSLESLMQPVHGHDDHYQLFKSGFSKTFKEGFFAPKGNLKETDQVDEEKQHLLKSEQAEDGNLDKVRIEEGDENYQAVEIIEKSDRENGKDKEFQENELEVPDER